MTDADITKEAIQDAPTDENDNDYYFDDYHYYYQDAPTEDYKHDDFYFDDYNHYYDVSTEDNNDYYRVS